MLPPRRWWSTAGAWLGIGTSPAALVLGAGLAERHDGPVPVIVPLIGALLMALLLTGQGFLGLRPPYGEGRRLGEVAAAYLEPRSQAAVGWLVALGMVGWLGFNAGLGGAALATLVDLPTWTGVLLLGLVLLGAGQGGLRSWNLLAVLTTASALLLVAVVAAHAGGSGTPVAVEADSVGSMTAGIATFVGYASVFALRAPDFTAGLPGRLDLAISVTLLVVPTLLVAAAGSLLWQATGSTDLVTELERSVAGNALVVAAVVAASLTSLHSGSLALSGVTRLPERPAVGVIAGCGLTLAVVGFHRLLVPWLVVLAAALPPLVVAMGAEAWRRRGGRPPRRVSGASWLPAAALALALTAAGVRSAALIGLAVAAVCVAVRGRGRRPRSDSRSGGPRVTRFP